MNIIYHNHNLIKTLKKTEVAIKNGQSRETGNIGRTRHETKTNKTMNTTQYVLDTTMRKQTQTQMCIYENTIP